MSGLFNWVFGRGTRKRKYNKLKTVAIEPDSSNIEHFRTDPNSTVKVRIKPKPKSDSASRLSKDTNNMKKETTFASNNKEDNFTGVAVGFGVRIGLRKTKKQKFQKKSRKNRKNRKK